jgi:urocanate hydratase
MCKIFWGLCFDYGFFGPFRWVCTSVIRDLIRADAIALQIKKERHGGSKEIQQQMQDNIKWIRGG